MEKSYLAIDQHNKNVSAGGVASESFRYCRIKERGQQAK